MAKKEKWYCSGCIEKCVIKMKHNAPIKCVVTGEDMQDGDCSAEKNISKDTGIKVIYNGSEYTQMKCSERMNACLLCDVKIDCDKYSDHFSEMFDDIPCVSEDYWKKTVIDNIEDPTPRIEISFQDDKYYLKEYKSEKSRVSCSGCALRNQCTDASLDSPMQVILDNFSCGSGVWKKVK
jgi:hypothetical protein